MATIDPSPPQVAAAHFEELARDYMRARRRLTTTLGVVFGLWLAGFVVLSAILRDVAARPIAGPLSTGWLYALSAFPLVIGLTWTFSRVSATSLDCSRSRAIAAANDQGGTR
ncbi:DUF485 domain-containing protein [Streptomyces sp. NPDC050625]|uniref:DUF485 domain-containing protein n=1 Tax=Streptomyces sp. NPDC050625 TaxID=3154629 RepID=UPI003421A6FA